MADKCTLFCRRDDPDGILHLAHVILSDIDRLEYDADLSLLTITQGSARLQASRRSPDQPGDGFSRLISWMHNFVRKIDTPAAASQQTLLDHIAACRAVVGVVAEPDFEAIATTNDLIFGMAHALDGVIFTGSSLLDSAGRLVLDQDGSSELENDRH